ncbi:hypothetical protein HK102_005833 [Quaeritorhiza haematococci]|nr:hypothetical protein HK102_005833 [Quaeritorhiza haematococci]
MFGTSIISEQHDGFIVSMNIHKRKIITGGKNGRIVVWNADDGSIIFSLTIPEFHIPELSRHGPHGTFNVAIWDDLVSYGLYDGTFCVHSITNGNLLYTFKDREIDNHGFTYAPTTLSMDSHFVLTNGAFPDELSVWSVQDGKRRYPLSESYALQKHDFFIPPFRDLKCAEISNDGSMFVGSVQFGDNMCLFVWDFRVMASPATSFALADRTCGGKTNREDDDGRVDVGGNSMGGGFANSYACSGYHASSSTSYQWESKPSSSILGSTSASSPSHSTPSTTRADGFRAGSASAVADRYFVKCKLREGLGFEFWLCYDEIPIS